MRILENGKLRAEWINPEDLGLQLAPLAALKGGELADNQAILEAVLQGRGTRAVLKATTSVCARDPCP